MRRAEARIAEAALPGPACSGAAAGVGPALAGAVVDATEPGSFGLMVTGDIVTHGKPHPEPYLTAAAQLGVHPAACIAIEDSPTGVRSATAAGVPTLAVPHIVEIPAIEGSVHVDSLAGLTPFDLVPLTTGAEEHART